MHLRETLVEALHYFTAPRVLVSDNERGLLCPTVLNYLRSLDINLYYAPTQKSEVNGQVERFHSTFYVEIYRCLKNELPTFKPVELVPIAVDRYNSNESETSRCFFRPLVEGKLSGSDRFPEADFRRCKGPNRA